MIFTRTLKRRSCCGVVIITVRNGPYLLSELENCFGACGRALTSNAPLTWNCSNSEWWAWSPLPLKLLISACNVNLRNRGRSNECASEWCDVVLDSEEVGHCSPSCPNDFNLSKQSSLRPNAINGLHFVPKEQVGRDAWVFNHGVYGQSSTAYRLISQQS